MVDNNDDLMALLAELSKEEYCYFTTKGRKSGRPHEIEIWFGIQANSLYLMSGGGNKADWVKNLLKAPQVTVRIAKHNFSGRARLVEDKDEEMTARVLLADKYKERAQDGSLSEWARMALVVGVDLNR